MTLYLKINTSIDDNLVNVNDYIFYTYNIFMLYLIQYFDSI